MARKGLQARKPRSPHRAEPKKEEQLAHHRAGHLDFVRKLANVGDWCVWLKLWYCRRAELTCDRMGLYCARSLRASQLALVNATVGAQLAAQVNTQEARSGSGTSTGESSSCNTGRCTRRTRIGWPGWSI